MGSVDDSANGVIEDRMIDWGHIRIDSLRATKESRRILASAISSSLAIASILVPRTPFGSCGKFWPRFLFF
jgi:hypothetical protein